MAAEDPVATQDLLQKLRPLFKVKISGTGIVVNPEPSKEPDDGQRS